MFFLATTASPRSPTMPWNLRCRRLGLGHRASTPEEQRRIVGAAPSRRRHVQRRRAAGFTRAPDAGYTDRPSEGHDVTRILTSGTDAALLNAFDP
jgi:hypothetical protein